MTKKEIEIIKKTAEAHGTLSEEAAEEVAKNVEKASEKMIEKEIEKEIEEEEAEKEKIIEAIKEPEKVGLRFSQKEDIEKWNPKTKLGLEVKTGKIKHIDEILQSKRKILEPQIVERLVTLKSDLVSIGQSKGKFGGGKRRAWRQTQRKTEEGNVPTFSCMAIVGDENGHVGVGFGKAQETLPARDKALRKAKLNVFKISRGCASFDCSCSESHTIPFKVSGDSGGVRINLIPAPQGTGLVAASELKKLLRLAGVKDVFTKTFGSTRTSFNLIKAGIDALKKTDSSNN